MSVKQCRDPYVLAGRAFQLIFSHPDWQIDNGFFDRPIMAHTKILVNRWGPEQVFWHCFTDRLNQSLVSSVVQATDLTDHHFLGVVASNVGKQ